MEERDKEPTAEQLQAIEDKDEGCPDGQAIEDKDEGCPDGWEEGQDA